MKTEWKREKSSLIDGGNRLYTIVTIENGFRSPGNFRELNCEIAFYVAESELLEKTWTEK